MAEASPYRITDRLPPTPMLPRAIPSLIAVRHAQTLNFEYYGNLHKNFRGHR